jgi:hypothetical protein
MKTLQNKGQAGTQGIVLTIVIVAILLMVAINVIGSVGTAINRSGFTTQQNTSFTNVNTQSFSAIDLTTVTLIVLAAAAILGAVFLFGRGK